MQGLGYVFSLLSALAIGFFLADFQGAQKVNRRLRAILYRRFARVWSHKNTYSALTSLLNEQSDEAVNAFIESLEVSADTLDVHLAMGSLLRRRGEMDRAVKVHQNLLTHANLPQEQLHLVQFELALDYWRSGLLDRAEQLLLEIADVAGVERSVQQHANETLLAIYQELGEWLSAIEIADRLTVAKFSLGADNYRKMQAHFCLELAQSALNQGDKEKTLHKIRRALTYDPDCARASLLEAELALKEGDFSHALDTVQTVAAHDARFLPEAINLFATQALAPTAFESLLQVLEHVQLPKPNLYLCLRVAEMKRSREGEASAIRYWLAQLEYFPELSTEAALFKLAVHAFDYEASEESKVRLPEALNHFHDIAKHHLQYRCSHCGFDSAVLSWHCPSCKSWAGIYLHSAHGTHAA